MHNDSHPQLVLGAHGHALVGQTGQAGCGTVSVIDWTPELESEIENRIITGESITKILQSLDISKQSFYRHKMDSASFGTTIVRAQEEAIEASVDDCRSIADSATVADWQVAQLKIRTIQWEAGKRKPKKYGDRTPGDSADNPIHGAFQIVSTVPRPPKAEQ